MFQKGPMPAIIIQLQATELNESTEHYEQLKEGLQVTGLFEALHVTAYRVSLNC